jgi:hypothetical protein
MSGGKGTAKIGRSRPPLLDSLLGEDQLNKALLLSYSLASGVVSVDGKRAWPELGFGDCGR